MSREPRGSIGLRVAGRLITLVVVALTLLAGRVAHADSIDTLIKQLEADSKNVRLAAAVNLAKQSDQRIVLPFVKVLGNDSDASVRSVAAAGLGRLVTSATKAVFRDLVVKTLTIASTNDDSKDVQKQAAASLALITGKAATTTVSNPGTGGGGGGAGGVYINVGPMSSKTGNADDPKFRDLMRKQTAKTLTKIAAAMAQTWAGGGTPSRAALDKSGTQGFYVDGTLVELKIKDAGSTSTISCKVSMLLASFPEKSMFGFLNGGASVSASTSASEKALASQDCIEAVIENLITKQVVPTIKSKI
ncbi:MAG: HEAT repeat domain-containing protein [Deltaproteobacteria bacterium]|nr:HEAT repeat domain-containing protein [Deltaproteobacteria bacterium]